MFRHLKQQLPFMIRVFSCTFFGAAWTLHAAIDWTRAGSHRVAEIAVPSGRNTGFTKLGGRETGLTFTNLLSDLGAAKNQILTSGSGVALGDIDGDGLCDIYTAGLEGDNKLFLNRGGWHFEASTDNPAIACHGQFSTGAVFADIDADNRLDLLVNSIGGGTRLFMNKGDAGFKEAVNAGLTNRLGAMSMALADIEGDGDLDLYVANYRTTTIRSTGLPMMVIDGKRTLRPEDRDNYEITPNGYIREHGEPDVLYINDGTGRFTEASWTDGRFLDEDGGPLDAAPRDWGLSVAFHDMNGDGAPDIYVCNDFWSPDRIWINDGGGSFRAIEQTAICSTSTFSMGVDFGDVNRDGFDDLFVLDMLSPSHVSRMVQTSGSDTGRIEVVRERTQVGRNTLQLNRGDNTYAEIAQLAGIEASGWSWGTVFVDVDLDGFEDILVTTGHLFDTQDRDAERHIRSLGPQPRGRSHLKVLDYPRHRLANVAFRNNGNLTFRETGDEWGFDFNGISQGMALADLDNDGDLDVVTNDMNAELGVYRNDSSAPRIQVRLNGPDGNPSGIGARVSVSGNQIVQHQEIVAGGRYLSGDQAVRSFAASGPGPFQIEVRWRDGAVERIPDARPNRIYEIEKTGSPHPPTRMVSPRPLFLDRSDLIGYRHVPEPDNDFGSAPLLPWKQSTRGPAAVAFDLNADGSADLILGGGAGSPPSVFWNDGSGGFTKPQPIDLPQGFSNEVNAMCGFEDATNGPSLALGIARSDGPDKGSAILIVDGTLAKRHFLPLGSDRVGAIAARDIDGDNTVDLFVGDRPTAARYPGPSNGHLLLQRGGTFVEGTRGRDTLDGVGVVNGAAWLRLAGKRDALIVATEWGPVKAFRNDEGTLTEVTDQFGLSDSNGYWQGIATGDFNNDGHEDFVVGNWGRNSRHERHRDHPLTLFAGDFDGNGHLDTVEAYFDPERDKTVPNLVWDHLARGIPYVRARFFTHRDYGMASIRDVLGNVVDSAIRLDVTCLETSIFLNRGERFERRPLPIEAQFAPAFTPVAADFDRDGNLDIFLSQNFFGTRPEDSRYDAGRGLLLVGDGNGGFRTMGGSKSGIKIYGEQRGAASADFDRDGRPDLVVARRNGTAVLLENHADTSPTR